MNPLLSNPTYLQIKNMAVSLIFAVGQLFFNRGLSSDPVLMCEIDTLSADSAVFSAQLSKAHNELMDDFLQSGLPLRMRVTTTLHKGDSGEVVDTTEFYHVIGFDLQRKTNFFIRSTVRETLFVRNAQICWNRFFSIPRIAVYIVPYRRVRFWVHVQTCLESVYVDPLEQHFDPMVFWKEHVPAARSPTVVMHFIDPYSKRKRKP